MKPLLSVLLFSLALKAQFVSDAWEFKRKVNTTPAPYGVLILDGSVYSSTRSRLNDLRLVSSKKEIPYVLRTLYGEIEQKNSAPQVINRIAIAGIGVQATLDVGRNVIHNRINIQATRSNFRQQVQIETSEDGDLWGVVRKDGLIFDVSTRDQHAFNLSVSYPDSTNRFLRVTIRGWTDPAWLQSTTVSFLQQTQARRDLAAEVAPDQSVDRLKHQTVLTCDLGFDRPYDRLTIETTGKLFSRTVMVDVSNDRKIWSTAAWGKIERRSDGERLTLELPEQWTRYVRATVMDEDNLPLTYTHIRFEALRREVLFPASSDGAYWLYSGNPNASSVRYDLVNVLPARPVVVGAMFGKLERNPEYRSPSKPVTETSPRLLTIVILILVPVIGAMAYRFLREANARST